MPVLIRSVDRAFTVVGVPTCTSLSFCLVPCENCGPLSGSLPLVPNGRKTGGLWRVLRFCLCCGRILLHGNDPPLSIALVYCLLAFVMAR